MKTFYYNLNQSGLIIFWGVVFLFFLFLFILIVLFLKNKELKKKISKLTENIEEEKIRYELLENKYKTIDNKKLELPAVQNLKKENFTEELQQKEEDIVEDNTTINQLSSDKNITEIKTIEKDNSKKEVYNNKGNNGNRYQTSPINIKKSEIDNSKSNFSYVSAVSKSLQDAVDPETIELTDYEKQQEEEAIISYKELLENKDKLYNITDDEVDINFIEELKLFRNDL